MNALRFVLALVALLLFAACILTVLVGGALVALGKTDLLQLGNILVWLFWPFVLALVLRGAVIWLQRRRGRA